MQRTVLTRYALGGARGLAAIAHVRAMMVKQHERPHLDRERRQIMRCITEAIHKLKLIATTGKRHRGDSTTQVEADATPRVHVAADERREKSIALQAQHMKLPVT